jgi:hypothetical protein
MQGWSYIGARGGPGPPKPQNFPLNFFFLQKIKILPPNFLNFLVLPPQIYFFSIWPLHFYKLGSATGYMQFQKVTIFK